MRLTNALRDAFINATMADVPKVDYKEQSRAVMHRAWVRSLPASIQALANDPALSRYLNLKWAYWLNVSAYLPCADGESIDLSNVFTPEEKLELVRLKDAELAQEKQSGELRSMLHGVAYGVTTRKALAEALPEFAKYLPAEQVKTGNLPALANVVAAFVQAGWPATT